MKLLPLRLVGTFALTGTVMMGLAGCSPADPKASAQRPAVVSARSDAAARVDSAVAKMIGAGQVLGTSREDWCDPGQDNLQVRSAYRFQCMLVRGALVVPAESDLESATAAVRAAFEDAGCSAPQLSASTIASDLESGRTNGASAECGGLSLSVRWALDPRGLPATIQLPNGFYVDEQRLSTDALAAMKTATPVAWYVSASIRYFYEAR